jgi:hypothetical protein
VFAALARHRPLPSTADLALGLASGVVVGRVLSFDVAVAPLQASRSATLITFDLLCVALLFAGVFLLLGWISDGALSWLASGAAGRSLRLAYAANLAIAGGLLAAGLGQLLVLHGMVEGVLGGSSGFDPAALAGVVGLFVGGGLLLIVSSPFTMAALASLWAFPLAAAWLPTSAGGRDGGWAYLDAAPSAVVSTAPSPFRVAEAVRRGLRGGLVFGVLLLALRLTVRLLVPEEVGLTDPQKLALYAAMIALAWLVQAFVAWRATKRIEWLGVAHGLLAGFVAGCVAAVGILGINLVFGGSIDLAWIWQVVGPTVAGGGVLALPAALVAAATGRSRGRLIAVPDGART